MIYFKLCITNYEPQLPVNENEDDKDDSKQQMDIDNKKNKLPLGTELQFAVLSHAYTKKYDTKLDKIMKQTTSIKINTYYNDLNFVTMHIIIKDIENAEYYLNN